MQLLIDFLPSIDINYYLKNGLKVLIAPFLGFLLHISLRICDQKWVSTFQHTLSFLMLPIITFSITIVIQDNIPLALGMVGALSIVRFRHPVKNAFELVMYFALITVGIACAAKLIFAIILTILLVLIIFAIKIYKFLLGEKSKDYLSMSFSEGEMQNTVEFSLKKKLAETNYESSLIQEFHNLENNTFNYRFAFKNKKLAKDFANSILKNFKNDILSISVDYN